MKPMLGLLDRIRDFWAGSPMFCIVGSVSDRVGLPIWFCNDSPHTRMESMVRYFRRRNSYGARTERQQSLRIWLLGHKTNQQSFRMGKARVYIGQAAIGQEASVTPCSNGVPRQRDSRHEFYTESLPCRRDSLEKYGKGYNTTRDQPLYMGNLLTLAMISGEERQRVTRGMFCS